MIFVASANGFNGPDCKAAPFQIWVIVEMSYYALSVILGIIFFQYLKRVRHESLCLIATNVLLGAVHSGWLIYGNVIYYQNNYACNDELKDTKSSQLPMTMFILLIIGYVTLMKFTFYAVMLICCLPVVIRAVRR